MAIAALFRFKTNNRRTKLSAALFRLFLATLFLFFGGVISGGVIAIKNMSILL